MGDVVVTEFISIDGVIEDPGGSEGFERGGWAFAFERGPEGDRFKFAELVAAGAQLLGRVTYDGFAAAWPTMEGTGEFGEKMNSMPKFVVSQTLENPSWTNTTVLRGELAAEVAELKRRYAGDILVAGSARLAQSLLAADLVDELRLMVFPIVLGTGKRLFAEGAEARTMRLAETRQTGAVVLSTFRRER